MRGHIEEEKIALLAGEDLEPGETAAANVHISGCRSCSAVLETYRERRQAMAALRDTGVAAGDFADVRRSVLARLPREGTGYFPVLNGRNGAVLRWAAVAAVFLSAAVIGDHIWEKTGTPPAQTGARIEIPSARPVPHATDTRPDPTAKSALAQQAARDPRKREQSGRRRTALAGVPPRIEAVDPVPQRDQAALPDDVAIKIETSDPNVIIIWLKSPKGAER